MKDLIINHEEIMKFWDYKKNNKYDVNDISVGNHNSFFWKCPVCQHEWKTRVGRLLNETKGCPNCKKNKSRIEHASEVGLICDEKELMLEWDYETNDIEGLLPTELSKKSKVIVNWICTKANHKWKSSIYNRVVHKRNCPYCSNQKILEGYNDLVTRDPDLAKEWNYEKNDKKPTEVGAGTGKKYWWKCEKGHEWEASVSNRHRLKVGCPYCSQSISFPEKAIFFYLKRYINDIIPNYRSKDINNKEIDIFLPNIKFGIEYDGLAFHNKLKDKEKDEICKNKGITLLHVAEKKGSKLMIKNNYIFYNPNNKKDLEIIINILLNNLLSSSEKNYNINIERDKNSIYNIILKINKQKALFNSNPELRKIWNYDKNKGLNPDLFSSGSRIFVWWKCEKGHEWQAMPCSIYRGSRCPICANQKLLKGYNDFATRYPQFLKEWNYKKNDKIGLKPDEIILGGKVKVWWKCEEGHEWQSTISNRIYGKGCPVCGRIKAWITRKSKKNNY